jgi:hypothetical protein
MPPSTMPEPSSRTQATAVQQAESTLEAQPARPDIVYLRLPLCFSPPARAAIAALMQELEDICRQRDLQVKAQ